MENSSLFPLLLFFLHAYLIQDTLKVQAGRPSVTMKLYLRDDYHLLIAVSTKEQAHLKLMQKNITNITPSFKTHISVARHIMYGLFITNIHVGMSVSRYV